MAAFFDRLRAGARERDSLLCIGLDPDPDQVPGGIAGAVRHCTGVVRRTADLACCYKPNSAFWEQYGVDGWKGLAEVRDAIPPELPVIFDAKRADIGSSMAAYARAAFEQLRMDAITVHAYHGHDSLAAVAKFSERGVFVVCRTSNPGAEDLQELSTRNGPVYLEVAALAARVGAQADVGLVVGATAPDQVARVRQAAPQLPFLLPGVGAQGGDLEASVRAAWNGDPASCIVSVTRGILYADDAEAAARDYRNRIRQLVTATA